MPKKATRPPVALAPSIPLDIQRAIRSVSQYAFDAQDRADAANAGLEGKVSKTPEDLLDVSQFVQSQLKAGGKYPLDLTALTGQTSVNQLANIPTVSMLPLRSHPYARQGQAVIYKGQLYVFNSLAGSTGESPVNPGAGSAPGTFQPVLAQPLYTQVTQSQLATLAATLGPANAGLLVWVTDYNHVLTWTGTGYAWGPGENGSNYFVGMATAPTAAGWHVCDGSFVNYLKSNGTLGGATLPNTASSAAYMKFGSAYNSTIQVADAPVFVGSPAVSDVTWNAGSTPQVAEAVQFPYTPSGAVHLPGDPIPNFSALLYFRQ
jgi:hypothetical protein